MQQVPCKPSKHQGKLHDEVLLRRYRTNGQSMSVVGDLRSRVRKKAEKPTHGVKALAVGDKRLSRLDGGEFKR